MISREDFVFTIGYDAAVPVVDAEAKNKYSALTTMELAEKGLFRAAFSSAVFSENEMEQNAFVAYYNAKAGTSYIRIEDLKKVFGVNLEDVKKPIKLK